MKALQTVNRNLGFTTFELLTAITLLSLITLMVFSAMQITRLTFDQGASDVRQKGDLKRAMETLTRDMREAMQGTIHENDGCNWTAPQNTCIVEDPNSYSVISFRVPESPTAYKTVAYLHNAQNLDSDSWSRVTISSTGVESAYATIARQITNVSFVPASNAVDVTITSGDDSITSRIYLRTASSN
ncbi:MAG: hypothetical protein HY582_04915 [Candidatus Omnitrophica bacterium]|nr:hypothetical protein [Candidatus Omnitrophota bacterium]